LHESVSVCCTSAEVTLFNKFHLEANANPEREIQHPVKSATFHFFFYNKGLLLFHRKANPDLVSRAGRDIRKRRFMRNYYASDKKKREESKRRQKEEKRLKRLNKNSENTIQSATEPASNSAATESDSAAQDPKG
jgi:hypothetical protein